METNKPLYTEIAKTIQTKYGMVILEKHTGFPVNESNLYCLSDDGEIIVWKAEKPEPTSLYSRVTLNVEGFTLSAYANTANTGHACEIELATGKLISQLEFK